MSISSGETAPQSSDSALITHAIPVLRRAVFLISLPFGILDFVLPIYGRSIGAGAVQIGLFFSAFSLMVVILRPVVGAALDRYGRRPFFLAGLAGYALTMLVFAFSTGVTAIVLARSIQGVASACLWLSAQAITADVASANDRGRTFGLVTQSNSQGAILGTFIGFGVMFSMGIALGWKPLFLGYALIGLAAVWVAARQLGETLPGVSALSGDHRPPRDQTIPWSRPWVLLLLVSGVTGASWAMLAPVLMIFLQDRLTVEVEQLALAFLPAGIVWALLSARLGGLADRFGRKSLMVLGMAAAALTFFMVPALTSLTSLAIFWAFQAACIAAGDSAEQALVADLTGDNVRGRAYGLYTMSAGIGMTIGPLAGGWLYQSIGQSAPFYASGVVLAGCALILQIFLRVPTRSENPA